MEERLVKQRYLYDLYVTVRFQFAATAFFVQRARRAEPGGRIRSVMRRVAIHAKRTRPAPTPIEQPGAAQPLGGRLRHGPPQDGEAGSRERESWPLVSERTSQSPTSASGAGSAVGSSTPARRAAVSASCAASME